MKKRTPAVIGILLAAVLVLASCSSSSSDSGPTQEEAAPQAAENTYYEDYDAWEPEAYDTWQENESTELPLVTPSSDPGSRIVYTVNLLLQTTGFETGTRYLLTTVTEISGYVQSAHVEGRSIYEPDDMRYARYVLRIPSDSLAAFLADMEDSYNLLRLEQESQDIARQYSETNSQLDYLLEQQQRLLEALELAEDTDDRLAIENELAEIQAQISRLSAASDSMDSAVIYSTVTVHLYEVVEPEDIEIVPDTFGTRAGSTASSSWSGFVRFCQGFVIFFIAAWPTLLVLAVIVTIIILIVRAKRKGVFKKILPEKQEKPKPPYTPYGGYTPPAGPDQVNDRRNDDHNL